jgi:predicted RNA-binding Zn-ribbon protein involved in translation (DUF1610 family)
MTTTFMVIVFIVAVVFGGIVKAISDTKAGIPQAKAAAARGKAAAARAQTAKIVCPQCQVAGKVTTRAIKQKKGISGGKATGAVLTSGVSMLATGLSRKEGATAAACGNCGSHWVF